MANFDKHLMVEKEWELKLKEELVTFKILKRPLFRVGGPSTGKGRSTHQGASTLHQDGVLAYLDRKSSLLGQ